MATPQDLDLPLTAPSMAQYHDRSTELLPAALYTLVDLSDAELQALQELCESESEGAEPNSVVLPAPQARFVNQPLRAVFDHHLQLGEQGAFDPRFFVVAIDKDWTNSGVLLVTLDDDDLECKVDKFRIKPQDSGLIFLNLQIGNSDWEESKEFYSLEHAADGSGNDEDDDGDDDDDDDHGDGKHHSEPNKATGLEPTPPDEAGDPELGPIPPKGPAPMGYFIGVYAVSSVDCPQLLRTIEPIAEEKQPQQYSCRLQAVIPADNADPVSAVIALHPTRCSTNPWLHKFLALVADTADPRQNGLVLVSLGGTAKGKEFPAGASQRIPCTVREGIQNTFCNMALGVRNWLPPERPAVGVFCSRAILETAAPLLDPRWDMRVTGEELLIFAPDYKMVEGRLVDLEYTLDEAVRCWPEVYYGQRFRSTLVHDYFIHVDASSEKIESVLLVKLDWDGNVEGWQEMVSSGGLRGKEETWQVDIKKAYKALKGLVEGTASWKDGTAFGG